ncbi:hypothetical protein LOTGIDRAFT_159082 [Lottia gigantea]|uniref:Uncharacterized protein n=1 Tax=Lottia gigantea TaxID=225164 RepID=V4AXI4_LOTGI|nr:hypothetical protein LOTGIDRAFT_159082 [Lottia gigantea]ESO98286.1 hypothetical protein LOTGIDRAFT_159082 [Lottia gigantea]
MVQQQINEQLNKMFKWTLSSNESSDETLRQGTSQNAQCLSVLEKREESDIYSSVLSIIKLIHQNIELKNTILLTGSMKKFPIEVWWMLNKDNVYTIENYIKRCDENSAQEVSEELFSLLEGDSGTRDIRQQIVTDFTDILVKIAFPEKKSEHQVPLKRMCMKILDGVTKGVLCQMKDFTEGTILHTFPPTDALKQSYYRKYAIHTLSFTMSYLPNMKVSQALQNQGEWKSAKTNPVRIQLYKQLMLVFEAREVLDILNRILERQEVNWENVLSFLATFLVCFKDASSLIEDHVKRLLSEGLEKGDMESTIVAFFLIRQSCLEGPHVFPSYQDWFQQTFGDSGRTVAESKKAFSFLMKFLTDVVPYELAVYLKAHVLKPPWSPVKCRDLLSDYILLAKTRLADLKQPIGSEDRYNETGHIVTARQKEEQAEQHVLKALSGFESTGKIPASVMEASIFRKPYFVGQFLPALLKPRPLPDIPDTRMKFMKLLHKADKISNTLYNQYVSNCQKAAQKLLQGVFNISDNEDNCMGDVSLPPVEQLKYRLNQLKDTLENNTHNKVNEVLSHISDKIELILNIDQKQSENSTDSVTIVTIDTDYPQLQPVYVDVVDTILNFICKMVYSDIQCNRQSDWLKGLLAILSQHRPLVNPLITRILVLLTSKDSSLKEHHIQGLSSIFCMMMSEGCQFNTVLVKDCSCSIPPSDILHVILKRMETKVPPALLLRFLSSYLQFGFYNNCFVNGCNEKLLKSYMLVCWRYKKCYDKTSYNDNCDITMTVYNSTLFQDLVKDIQITIREWLEFESNVYGKDELSELQRYEYHSDIIYNHFLRDYDAVAVASELFQCCLLLQDSGTICDMCSRSGDGHSVSEWNNLLQSILPLLPSQKDDDEPWAIRQWQKYIGESSSDKRCFQTLIFIRSIMKFPSHLLFVNHTFDVTPNMVSAALEFLKNHMKEHINEGCYFTLPFTVYILQGLISVSQFLEDRKILQQISLQNIFLVSFVVHWKHIQHLWSKLNLPLVNISSFDIATDTRVVLEENGFSSLPSKSELCVAASLFSILIKRKYIDVEAVMEQITLSLSNQTAVNLLDMILCYSAVNSVSEIDSCENTGRCKKVVNFIISRAPSVFPVIFTDCIIKQYLASAEAKRYYEFTILRSLSELSDDKLKHFLEEKMNCKHIITCFSKITEKFDQDSKQPIDEILDHCNFTKKCLKMTPQSHLLFIDKSLVKNCGIDVYNLFISLSTR